MTDIRWKQRFNNYIKALQVLRGDMALVEERDLSDLEQRGVIQSFEFTHELAWNVLKDYLKYQGVQNVIASKDASRMAFQNGLIDDGPHWMEMITARNKTSHIYNQAAAEEIMNSIQEKYYPAFESMAKKFTILYEQPDDDL